VTEATDAELLRAYTRQSLQRLAKWRGLDARGLNKAKLIELLADELFEVDAIGRNLAGLLPVEQRTMDEVHLLGGDAPTALVMRRLQQEGAIESMPRSARVGSTYGAVRSTAASAVDDVLDGLATRGDSRSAVPPRFDQVLTGLATRGLVLSYAPGAYGSAVDFNAPGRRLVIPTRVLEQLSPISVPLASAAQPEQVLLGSSEAVLRDLYAVLAAANLAPIPLTSRGLIPKRALVQLDHQLRVTEFAAEAASEHDLKRLPLLRMLAEDLGLLVASPNALSATDRVPDFLDQPRGQRLSQLLGAYRETARWCEVLHIPGLEIQTGGAGRGTPREVIQARQLVLAHLAQLPTELWITLDSLLALFRRCAYELLFRRQLPVTEPHWYYDNPYAGNNSTGWTFARGISEEQGWDVVERGLIEIVIEALHWLGVLDLGADETGLSAIRITADGNRLLRNEALPVAPVAPNVVVQPNFQIFVFEPIQESVLFTLDQFAERVRAEQAVEYLVTRESVYRAQRAGLEASAIIAFLDRVSTVPLAQNVRRSLEEWGALHERVVLRRATPLVHTVDAATLDALYADAQVAPLLGRRLAPTAALVAAADLGALQQRLLATDRLPALSEGRLPTVSEGRPPVLYQAGPSGLGQRPQPPALTIDADGRVQFVQRLPDISVLRAINQIADSQCQVDPPGDAVSLQLTPSSLRRAADAGLSADDILAVLSRLHVGDVPPQVQALVRRAGRRWGRGALASATLLQVESLDILSALLEDPDLAPHLHRLSGAECLALVPRDSLKHVRAALQARGMDLATTLFEQP
jgi:hypothetical protein